MPRHSRLPVFFFSLLIILFATLGAQDAFSRASRDAVARTSDDADDIHRALEVLRDAIIDAARTNTTDPISEALWNFWEVDATSFELAFTGSIPQSPCYQVDDTSEPVCPDWSADVSPPPPGVRAEEWERFGRFLNGASFTEFTSPPGSMEYLSVTLVDLNEDGLRDLVVETPPVGTGLFEHTYVFQSDDVNGFRLIVCNDGEPYPFYSGGRGFDVNLYRLRIDDRSYFAVRVSEYGEEDITLHRPLLSTDQNEAEESVRVRYDITHRVDDQSTDTRPDGPGIDRALIDHLNRIFQDGADANDRCPVPADQRDRVKRGWQGDPDTYWPWVFPLHYNDPNDRLDVFAVKTPAACYQAQVVAFRANGFFSFEPTDCCRVELQEGPFSPSIDIPLETHRTLKGVELISFSRDDSP